MQPEQRASGALRLLRESGAWLLRRPRGLWCGVALAWMALIWWLSSGSVDLGPRLPWLGFLSNLAHAPLFGLLALWLALLLPRRVEPFVWTRLEGAGRLLVLALVLGWGTLDEWHQSHTPGRNSSWTDIVTDLTGAACVLWIASCAGASGATSKGLLVRLCLGLAACCAAAGLATSLDR